MDKKSGNQKIIEIKNLYKTFSTKDGEVSALKDINLDIYKGNIYGIIGMSGAGKSTLVRCINYLEKPTSGTVIVGGKDLSQITEKELRSVRHNVSMIFQQFNLLMQSTVLENVLFPLEIIGANKEGATKRAKELLEVVGLSDKISAYPSQLSGGQKQRVGIARALATNPSVLLCDEATSALDPNTTQAILELLKGINEKLGITIVIITHEMSVVEDICTHVAVIEDGEVIEKGTVKEIFTHPKSKWTKNILGPEKETIDSMKGDFIRIVFDGTTTYETVISNMVIETGCKVSVVFADVKEIEGNALGQMVIGLPEDKKDKEKVINYLNNKKLVIERIDEYNG